MEGNSEKSSTDNKVDSLLKSESAVSQSQQRIQTLYSKQYKKPLIMIGILLGFMLIGVGGYTLGVQRCGQINKTNVTVLPTQSPAPTEIDTNISVTENSRGVPDKTTCSDSYTSEKYGFSINCPNNWIATLYEKEKKYKQDGTAPYFRESDLALLKLRSQVDNFGIDILIIENEELSESSANSSSVSDTNDTSNMTGAPGAIKELGEIMVAGISSRKYSSTGPGNVTNTVVTKTEKYTYEFRMDETYWDENLKAEEDILYSDLLSSFDLLKR